jgi:hypothetical protein
MCSANVSRRPRRRFQKRWSRVAAHLKAHDPTASTSNFVRATIAPREGRPGRLRSRYSTTRPSESSRRPSQRRRIAPGGTPASRDA